MRRIFVLGVALSMLGSACGGDGDSGGAPDTVIDEAPAAVTNQTRVRFTFRGVDAADTFRCQLDGGELTECTPPFEADVAEGAHSFRVSAALGTAYDETPAEHGWTVDVTAPETTIVSGPPALDNSLTPTFSFAGTDGNGGAVTYECALDGDPFAACQSPANLVVVDGAHVFAVRAKDLAGNVDATPAEHPWSIDATAPETVITAGPADGATTGRAVTFSFTSPDAAAVFDCKLDNGTFSPCTSPRALTALSGGSHTFTVRARDTSAMDPSPASRTWTVDAIAPVVTITSTPSDPSNDSTPAFAFTSDDAMATHECQIDNVVAFTACTSPWTPPALMEGVQTFRVRATDPHGNVSISQSFVWRVDVTPPDTTILTAEPSPTTDRTGDFTFTAAPVSGSTFECSVDGDAFAACTSPFATTSLADGTHAIAVRAVDAAGNADPTPATRQWIVDTTPPDTTIATFEPDPTNDPTSEFGFTANEPATFQCAIDGGNFAACGATFTTPALGDGPHTLRVRAIDTVGLVDDSPASYTWTVDTVAPDTTIASAPANPTNDDTASFTFTSPDATAAFECSLDGGAFAACSASFTTAALADGSHTLRVRAVDPAGNADGSPDSHTWTIDTVAPGTTITSAEPDPTNDATGDFQFAATQAGSTFACSIDGGAFTSCTSPLQTAALADGPHTFAVRATDPAGNVDATPASHAWTIDTVDPETTIATAPSDPSSDATGDFTFTASEPGVTFECSVDGAAFTACTTPFATAPLADGDHTFAVRARDAANNADTSPDTHAWTIETPPETMIIEGPRTPDTDTTPTFTFSSTESGSTFECRIDTGAFVPCTSPLTTATLPEGPHTFAVRATDARGNVDVTPASHSWTIDLTPTVSVVGAGSFHTCAVVDGSAQCWGNSAQGTLGHTSSEYREPRQVVGLTSGVQAIQGGDNHTCAIVNGGARCWGDNAFGQLGNTTFVDSGVPVQVSGLTSGVQAIASGARHVCVIRNGGAQCWGANHHGQLGNNSTANSSVPVQVEGLTSGVQAIAAGVDTTCALVNGSVKCWGENLRGGLGNDSTTDSWVPVQVVGLTSGVQAIAVGQYHSCAVANGGVQCWGANDSGQLGNDCGPMSDCTIDSHVPVPVSSLSGVQAIAAGGSHTCALANGGLQCWGFNNSGQLGTNSTDDSHVPVAVIGLGSGVQAFDTGQYHSCAVAPDGLKCWGWNIHGQLGNGSTTSSSVPVSVSGL